MLARRRAFVVSCTFGCGLVAASALAQVPVADAVFSRDVYPEVRASFRAGVVGIPDVTYATASGYRRLKLDLYIPPPSSAGPHPVIVYIHGGGWSGGTPRTTGAFENWPEVLASFAARGFVVASLQYRLSGEAPFPAALHDVKSAIRWLRTNATTYNIDTQRFVTWGVSAGGQLAGLAAVSCGVAELEPPAAAGRGGGRGGAGGGPAAGGRGDAAPPAPAAPPASNCVQGSVLWYAASSLERAATAATGRAGGAPTENAYLGCTPPDCATQSKAATVNTYVDATDPPMLLIHGETDTTVSVDQSRDPGCPP